uniref:RING-type domain-containing protein n=1 Tax=viral metagenome TaxID=1070528 RepID=A0A6C0K3Y3_9ZZZZ
MDCICGICLLPMDQHRRRHQLQCHHSFHRDCIRKWHQYKVNCPLCRKGDGDGDGDEEKEDLSLSMTAIARCFYMVESFTLMIVFSLWTSLIIGLFAISIFRFFSQFSFLYPQTTLPASYHQEMGGNLSWPVCFPHEEP